MSLFLITWHGLASSPGPSQILSPRLQDKIWEGPGDEARHCLHPYLSLTTTTWEYILLLDFSSENS